MNRHQRRAEEARERRDQKSMRALERERAASEPRQIGKGWKLFWLAYFVLIAFWFLMAWASPGHAHSWYDPACCSGEDCAPAPVGSVTATESGWLIEIPPNGHPMVGPEGWTGLFPYDSPKIKDSQDGQFHICIGPKTKAAFCLYVPKGSQGA